MPERPFGVGGRSDADRNLQRHRMRRQPVDDLLERPLEIGPDPVHLVDEADAGNAVFVGLPPDRLALGLDPFHGAENHHAPSSTRRLRSTSAVKSTCPGVSMMLIVCSGMPAASFFQRQVMAAE